MCRETGTFTTGFRRLRFATHRQRPAVHLRHHRVYNTPTARPLRCAAPFVAPQIRCGGEPQYRSKQKELAPGGLQAIYLDQPPSSQAGTYDVLC